MLGWPPLLAVVLLLLAGPVLSDVPLFGSSQPWMDEFRAGSGFVLPLQTRHALHNPRGLLRSGSLAVHGAVTVG